MIGTVVNGTAVTVEKEEQEKRETGDRLPTEENSDGDLELVLRCLESPYSESTVYATE